MGRLGARGLLRALLPRPEHANTPFVANGRARTPANFRARDSPFQPFTIHIPPCPPVDPLLINNKDPVCPGLGKEQREIRLLTKGKALSKARVAVKQIGCFVPQRWKNTA